MRIVGVDLGIAKLAYSVWRDGELIEVDAVDYSKVHTRQHQLRSLGLFGASAVAHARPDTVFIEDILIGNNRKYSLRLAETKGAVLAQMHRFSVIPVNVSTWKKEVLGNGKATKDDIRAWLSGQDSAYADLCGDDQDQYDAACIGFYGHIIATRAAQLADAR
jgi:Holliday junction resolvasome RuvABC endonuclease subunit